MRPNRGDTIPRVPPRSEPDVDVGVLCPALTIIWHPDIERIGEVAALEPLAREGRVLVSRHSPKFAPPGSSGRDLETRRISGRQPSLEIIARADDPNVELRPCPTELPTEVQGIPLTKPIFLTPGELDAGVVLLIGREIVLCLHRIRVPIIRGPSLDMIGTSDAMERVRRDVQRVADLDATVLIVGETGTGKELVARALASLSRRDKSFTAVNMASLPTPMAASELFGHERGAFTGADRDRGGLFAAAAGGTLFLDEIGATTFEVQTLLLRALGEREIRPVGGDRHFKTDVRLVVATDTDLPAAIANGHFSRPLFERLHELQIALPSLRNRREDFGSLFVSFLLKALEMTGDAHRLRQPADSDGQWLAPSKVARLAMWSWPGNVRALRNATLKIASASRDERRAVLGPAVEDMLKEHDGAPPWDEARRNTPRSPLAVSRGAWRGTDAELLEALENNNWHQAKTAADLGIPRTSLADLIEKSPGIRKAADIPEHELSDVFDACGGDVALMASKFRVSEHGLKLRIAQWRRRR